MAWQIISQQQRTGQNDAGQYVPGVNVTFRTDKGSVDTVFVPNASYNEDTVKMLITQQAITMDNIAQLQG